MAAKEYLEGSTLTEAARAYQEAWHKRAELQNTGTATTEELMLAQSRVDYTHAYLLTRSPEEK